MKSTLQNAHKYDLGIIAAGLLAFLFSLFPYYKASVQANGDPSGLGMAVDGDIGTWNAWHGFFGWFAALAALAAAGVMIARLLGVGLDASMTRLIALAGFAVATVCALLTFVVNPLPGTEGKQDLGAGVSFEYAKGHAWGFWLSLLVILAGLALSVMRKEAKD
ncbi:MAG: hypothetical protein H0T17_06650 [Propionibacteriales bacterium]|nr:hypothetical protein [Propionibacteriales bacterium]